MGASPKKLFSGRGSVQPFLLNVIGLAVLACCMTQPAKLQLIGPVTLFIAICSAEVSAAALAYWPSSAILWRANLEWFHAFQRSSYLVSAYTPGLADQFWMIGCPLLSLAMWGLLRNRPLFLAISCNLSLLYAVFVFYADYLFGHSWREVSLLALTASPNMDLTFCLVLIAFSFLSAAVSHLYYIRAIGAVLD